MILPVDNAVSMYDYLHLPVPSVDIICPLETLSPDPDAIAFRITSAIYANLAASFGRVFQTFQIFII